MAAGRSLLSAVLLATCVLTANSLADLVLTNVDREIVIKNSIVTIQDTIKVNNPSKSTVNELLLCTSLKLMANAALQEVVQQDEGDFYEIKTAPTEAPAGPEGVACLLATLQPPLKGGQTTNLKMYAVYTHMLTPFPATVTQKDPQLMVYEDHLHLLTPYTVQARSAKVVLPSSTVPSYSKPATKSGEKLSYTASGETAPWAADPLYLHFENNQPQLLVQRLEREFEVSHWGNVYVEEKYKVRHAGAQLVGPWSRLDLQVNPALYGRTSIPSFSLQLPAGARTLYYRDEIGNISTSRVRTTRSKVEVTLEPRYPLFGGWQTQFTFGYSLPLGNVVSKLPGGWLRFSALLGCPIKDAVVEQLEVRVVLPEGAQKLQADLPLHGVEVASDVKYTYLDSVGRPVLVLSKGNVVPDQNVMFAIRYRFPFLAMWREPLLLILAFAALFATAIATNRLDFAMSKDEKWRAKQEAERITGSAQRLEKLLLDRRAMLRDLDVAAASKPVDECLALKAAADASAKASDAKIKALLAEMECVSPRTTARFREVCEKEKALVAAAGALFTKKMELLKQGAKATDIEKKVGAQEKAVVESAKEIKAMIDALMEPY